MQMKITLTSSDLLFIFPYLSHLPTVYLKYVSGIGLRTFYLILKTFNEVEDIIPTLQTRPGVWRQGSCPSPITGSVDGALPWTKQTVMQNPHILWWASILHLDYPYRTGVILAVSKVWRYYSVLSYSFMESLHLRVNCMPAFSQRLGCNGSHGCGPSVWKPQMVLE